MNWWSCRATHARQQDAEEPIVVQEVVSIMTSMMMRAAVRSFVRRGRVIVPQRQRVLLASPALPSSPVGAALHSCCFSTETKATEEKPIIPGIGKGKTSTGLVRFRATTRIKLSLVLMFSCLYLKPGRVAGGTRLVQYYAKKVSGPSR